MGAIAPKEDAKGGRFLTPFAQWVQLLRKMHAHNTEKVSFWPIIGWFCSEKRWLSAGEILGAIAPNYAIIAVEPSKPIACSVKGVMISPFFIINSSRTVPV